ncbi:MAG: hypothetical protein AB1571_02190 [Nanoarchaeota archaeon]
MAKKNLIGGWAFLIGVIIAIAAGFLQLETGLTGLLIVLGLIVGLLNVVTKETMPFLLASVALVIVAAFGGNVISEVQLIGPILGRMLNAIIVFIVPATLVVAIKAVYALARD